MYMYVYVYVYMYVCIKKNNIYIYIERERDIKSEREMYVCISYTQVAHSSVLLFPHETCWFIIGGLFIRGQGYMHYTYYYRLVADSTQTIHLHTRITSNKT